MSKLSPTAALSGAPVSFNSAPGISIASDAPGEVLYGELFFKEAIPVLDPTGDRTRMGYHADSRRCKIVEKGNWIYISWPVEDDTDVYFLNGTRRLWIKTTVANVHCHQPEGDCPAWLR
jgi:hypothetical protein